MNKMNKYKNKHKNAHVKCINMRKIYMHILDIYTRLWQYKRKQTK